MSDWLDKKDYVPLAPDHVGTIQVHHCKSGSGNNRLFITRCEDGFTILAFCHHCGKRGKEDTKASATIEDMTFIPATRTGGVFELPKDLIKTLGDWPVQADMWIKKAKVTSQEAVNHKITYSPSFRRVIIPSYTFKKLSSYQSRRVFSGEGPKYATYKNFDGLPFRAFSGASGGKKKMVICEDALSTIRCGRFYPSIALLGTHLSDVVLAYFVEIGVQDFLIFMDDDNIDVKMRQQVLHKRLQTFGQVKVHHSEGVDPKEHNDDALKRILDIE